MAIQAGKTVSARVSASSSGAVVRDGRVVAQFWRPGRDPRADAGVRSAPDHVFDCVFDGRYWVAAVDTEGWEPGSWTARGHVSGTVRPGVTARGWDWQKLELEA
jgi:hypothetical protein